MATALNEYRVAWALKIVGPSTIYAATTDLPEDNAVATLGAFYTKRITNIDAVLSQELPNLFYGIAASGAVEFELNNADLALAASSDWRGALVTLYHYDRNTNTKTTDYTGFVSRAVFANTRVTLSCAQYDSALFQQLLPAAVIDPKVGSPFEKSDSGGVPIPVVFGEDVPVQPPNATNDLVSDPGGIDFVVGHDTLYVRRVMQDIDPNISGLERLGTFTAAPGTPVYVSTTRFSVSNDQRDRFLVDGTDAGMHIRFKTTASGGVFLYSSVKAYDTGVSPHQVEIADALLDSGMTDVQIAGDFLVVRSYQNVTDGLLPVPGGSGADMTAVRLFDEGDSRPIVFADNPSYPLASTSIGDVISATLTNATWGLSALQTQLVNAASFATADVALALAGLTGAICGALAYDQQQRTAEAIFSEWLPMRGIRLTQNDSLEWVVTVDTQPAASSKTFQLGSGDYYGIPIKRVLDHGRINSDEAVRSLVLHWSALGRSQSAAQRLTPREYGRISRKAVSAVGQEVHLYNPWIRDQTIAEKVCHYIAEKLAGADERLTFVAGQEARDVTLGEVVTVEVPTDGITGDWQVYGIRKTLNDVTLSCFRANSDAYGSVSGVTSSDEIDAFERRTETGSGANLLTNPDFSGPYAKTGSSFVPRDWLRGGVTVTPDYSAATAAQTIGGHYLRIVSPADQTPTATPTSYFVKTLEFPCPEERLLLVSFYCDATSGIGAVLNCLNTSGGGVSGGLLFLVRDTTDTNPAGWARWYGRTRAGAGTATAILTIAPWKAGTYQVDGVQVEPVGRAGRRPSSWRRHRVPPVTIRDSYEFTFNGASTYTASLLIPSGVSVKGVSSRVTSAITFGTATSYTIGTSTNPDAWGASLTGVALDTVTTAADFLTTSPVYFATATSVVLTANGTITSGKMRVTVEYDTPAPASGA